MVLGSRNMCRFQVITPFVTNLNCGQLVNGLFVLTGLQCPKLQIKSGATLN